MISKGTFTFNGTSSDTFGLYTAGSGIFNSPVRDVEEIIIPGRNGTLTKDNGRFENVEVIFTVVYIGNDIVSQIQNIKAWLLSPIGMVSIRDSFEPEFIRYGRLSGSIDWTIGELMQYGKADIKFLCRPQRYQYNTTTYTNKTAEFDVVNPYLFDAKPWFQVYGSGAGVLNVGSQSITISAIDSYVTIDSEAQNVYKGTSNKNHTVRMNEFPVFPADSTTHVSWSGGITNVRVRERLWTV